MTINLTERALYLIIRALVHFKSTAKLKELRTELDDLIQDLQFQRGIE